MKYLIADFETFYSDTFSLRKMTPVEYVLDRRFEANGCAFKWGIRGKSFWVDGPDLQAFFDSLDPNDIAMVTHNALFDMCIVAWRFGFVPRLMIDTLGVARATLGYLLRSCSLDSVGKHLQLGGKLHAGAALNKAKGMTLAMIKAAGFYDEYVAYALDDCDKCAGIFEKLVYSGKFPVSELAVMDMVLRCTIQPQFVLDQNVLALHLAEVKARKDQLLAQISMIGAGKADLMSNDKFAALLRQHGVEPPMKPSPSHPEIQTYAFAKSDEEFVELTEHPDDMVQALVAARLGHKSTLEETRTGRFTSIGRLQWPTVPGKSVTPRGNMPVPLAYGAAHTHRLGGTWSLNMQNLGRKSKLRSALTADEEHAVISADASQIEARMVAWLAGQEDLIAAFERGEDVYAGFASDIYQRPINKKDDPNERFVGKVGILQLGYQSWVDTYIAKLKTLSREQTGTAIELSFDEGARVVNTYRSRYDKIKALWVTLMHEGIPALASGSGFTLGPCVFEKEAILLPNGLRLHYHDLHWDPGSRGWTFTYGGNRKKIYGGKLLENISQALARICTFDAGVRIQRRFVADFGTWLALQGHDELVYLPPIELAPQARLVALEEMHRRPIWGPTLPLAAEASAPARNYGAAK